MVDDTPDNEQPESEETDETSDPSAPTDGEGTEFVADDEGNVEVVEPAGGWGGPEQDFGGVRMGGPFQGRERFVLTPAGFWSRALKLLLLLGGVIYFVNVIPAVVSSGLTLWRLIGLAGIPLVAGLAILYRWWKLPDGPVEIRFEDDHIDMPKGADNPSRVQVDYRDIRSLVVMARGETEILLFETEHHRFTYSDIDIREPNGARALRDEIMRRVRNHPERDAIVGQMEALEERARAAADVPTPVTYTLIGAVVAGYVLQHVTAAWSTEFGLLQIGANSAALVLEGQWWRLISANFLHGNFLHISLNGLALLFLGISIERLIGSWRLLLIYLVTAVGGSAGSVWLTEAPMSLGASTALYGLVGAFLTLHFKYWNEIPPPYRQTIRWWVIILALNFGLSALPMVDAAAHFVGMAVGMVLTFAILLPLPSLDPGTEAGLPVKVATTALTALFAAGLGLAWNYAQVDHPDDGVRVVDRMIERAEQGGAPRQLNRAAWRAVTWGDAPLSLLERARKTASSAVELGREKDFSQDAIVQFRDTEATALFRIARVESDPPNEEKLRRAIEIEREVLAEAEAIVEEQPVVRAPSWSAIWGGQLSEGDIEQFRAQLFRFLDVYAEAHGVYSVGEPPPEGAKLNLASRSGRLALVSEFESRLPQTAEWTAVAVRSGERLGAFRVCLPQGAKSGVVERFSPDRWSAKIDGEASVRLVATNTESPDCPEDEESVEFWPNVPSVRDLP